MSQYKIRFAYTSDTGHRHEEEDTLTAWCAQEAVDQIRKWYSDLKNFHIDIVWKDRNNRWEICEAWD